MNILEIERYKIQKLEITWDHFTTKSIVHHFPLFDFSPVGKYKCVAKGQGWCMFSLVLLKDG